MRRFLTVILTLIILPTTVSLIIAWTTFATLNNPTLIKKTLTSNDTYFKLSNLLTSYINQQEDDPLLFTKEQKQRIAKAAVGEALAQEKIEPVIDNYYDWLNKSKPLNLEIDIKTVKNNAKQEILSIFKEQYAALPECSSSELLLAKLQSKNENSFPTCRIPSDNKYDSVYKNFDPNIINTTALDNIPDKIILPSPTGKNSIPGIFQKMRSLLIISSLANLIFILLALYLLLPYKKALFRYLCTLSFLLGGLLLALQYLVLLIIQNELSDWVNFIVVKNKPVKEIVLPIMTSLITGIKNSFYLTGFILIASGVIFLIISFIIKNSQKNIQIIQEDQLKTQTKI